MDAVDNGVFGVFRSKRRKNTSIASLTTSSQCLLHLIVVVVVVVDNNRYSPVWMLRMRFYGIREWIEME